MTRLSGALLAAALVALSPAAAPAGERVGVSGSGTQYETRVESNVGGKPVTLVLTGAALRRKVVFNVYTVGSYLQEGAGVRSAEELAAADAPKQLHLVMERAVPGKEMAEAFAGAIRANYPSPAFDAEMGALAEMMEALSVEKGDAVRITHIPQKGIHCDVAGKKEFLIDNPAFSRAVWDIYLGKNNLGEAVKKGLTSRL